MENITHAVGCDCWIRSHKPPPTALLLYFEPYTATFEQKFVCSSVKSLISQCKFVSVYRNQCHRSIEIIVTKRKMPPKKKSENPSSTKESIAVRPRGRPRRNVKQSTKLDAFEINTDLDTSVLENSGMKYVEINNKNSNSIFNIYF